MIHATKLSSLPQFGGLFGQVSVMASPQLGETKPTH
jgi:hypothetical protein